MDVLGANRIITIIDAGIGNPKSISNMLNYLGISSTIMQKPSSSMSQSHLILPGVGSFDAGIQRLKESGWHSYIKDSDTNINILGICLGMHLLTRGSDEGNLPGLEIVPAFCRKFDVSKCNVPHIGWNTVTPILDNPLIGLDAGEKKFYFSHSYYVVPDQISTLTMQTKYSNTFCSGVSLGNVHGVQFHPEKSHKFGMDLLRNFSRL